MQTEKDKIQYLNEYGYDVYCRFLHDKKYEYEIIDPHDDTDGYHVIGDITVLDEAIEMIKASKG